MKQVVSFDKLKLTNHQLDDNGHVIYDAQCSGRFIHNLFLNLIREQKIYSNFLHLNLGSNTYQLAIFFILKTQRKNLIIINKKGIKKSQVKSLFFSSLHTNESKSENCLFFSYLVEKTVPKALPINF